MQELKTAATIKTKAPSHKGLIEIFFDFSLHNDVYL